MPLIRAAALMCFTDVVGELGGDAVGLLQREGITTALLDDPDVSVDFDAFAAVLEHAAVTLDRPDLGRVLARRQGIEVFGALGAVAMTAPTLGAGLGMVRRYLPSFTDAMEVDLDEGPTVSRFWFRTLQSGGSPHAQAMELILVRTLTTVQQTVGHGYRPLAVLVPHTPRAGLDSYSVDLGPQVRFGQGVAGLLMRTADLARELSGDAEVHRVVQAYLEDRGQRADEGLADVVRRILERTLTAEPSLATVARHLDLHPRTVQRRLAKHGTTVAELLDEVRCSLADRYLRETDLSFGQIAGLLGYSEQSVLTRASARWFGATPTAVREAALG